MKNITNKTKTILFASLIAALILPFSSMDFAEAAPNENANDKAKDKVSLKELVDNKKTQLTKELSKVEKEQDRSTNKSEHTSKLKRVLYRLDLVEAIISLPNWDHTSEMTPEDLEKRTSLAILLHQAGEEENKLKKNVIAPSYDAPIISASHSQGNWDHAYHTSADGRVNCKDQEDSTKFYEGKSDGLIEVYSTRSLFSNTWNYEEELWKNSTQGCADPPNDHVKNEAKMVDVHGSATDCIASTTNPTGISGKYCSGFTEDVIVIIYTRGSYENNATLESAGWGFGAIIGL